MSQKAGLTLTVLWLLITLGYIDLREGQSQQAHEHFTEALHRFDQAGRKRGVLRAVEGLASLAARQAQGEWAIHLYAWADTVRQADDDPHTPLEQADVDRDLAAIRTQLDETTFNAAWIEGRAMTMEQVVAYALAESAADSGNID